MTIFTNRQRFWVSALVIISALLQFIYHTLTPDEWAFLSERHQQIFDGIVIGAALALTYVDAAEALRK